MEKWCLINLTLLPTGFLSSSPHSPLSIWCSWFLVGYWVALLSTFKGGWRGRSFLSKTKQTSLGQTQTKSGTVPKTWAFPFSWTGELHFGCVKVCCREVVSDSTFGEIKPDITQQEPIQWSGRSKTLHSQPEMSTERQVKFVMTLSQTNRESSGQAI